MNTEKIITADSSPYPEIRVQSENKRLAAQLNAAFAGTGGEFGNISEYVYQSIMFSGSEYGKIFMELAKVEMHHLAILGEVIRKLGGKPFYGWYSEGKEQFWNGSYVNYTQDLLAALVHDLNGEQRAYSSYVSLARQSGDRYVFAVLTRIALDEMIHASLLKSLIAKQNHTKA